MISHTHTPYSSDEVLPHQTKMQKEKKTDMLTAVVVTHHHHIQENRYI